MSQPRVRPALPFVLFTAGVALSCSTACMTLAATSAAVDTVKKAVTPTKLELAQKELAANVRNQGGPTAPVITADLKSLEDALRPALPPGTPGADQGVTVVRIADPSGGDHLLITAWGGFLDYPYVEAFARYADDLRKRQPRPLPVKVVVQAAYSGRRSHFGTYEYQ